MDLNKKINKIWLLIFIVFTTAYFSSLSIVNAQSSSDLAASKMLNSIVSKLKKSGGVETAFSLHSGGSKIVGTIKWQGNKFCVITPEISNWYDGKNLWTYSKSTSETTLSSPSAKELAEINPMLFLRAAERFNVKFAKNQNAGSKTLLLIPKSKKEGIVSVLVSINSRNNLPHNIVVNSKSGSKITLDIHSVKTGNKYSSGVFTYPKKNYPKAKVIDLR